MLQSFRGDDEDHAGKHFAKQLIPENRPVYTRDFKLTLLRDVAENGMSMARAARKNGVHTSTAFRWRNEYLEGKLGTTLRNGEALALSRNFIPVQITDDREGTETPEPSKEPRIVAITFPGNIHLRFKADIDEQALRSVLSAVNDLS